MSIKLICVQQRAESEQDCYAFQLLIEFKLQIFIIKYILNKLNMRSVISSMMAVIAFGQNQPASEGFALTQECLLKSELVTASAGGTKIDETQNILDLGATSDWRMISF